MWKSQFSSDINIIREFAASDTLNLCDYSDEDTKQILALVKSETVLLRPRLEEEEEEEEESISSSDDLEENFVYDGDDVSDEDDNTTRCYIRTAEGTAEMSEKQALVITSDTDSIITDENQFLAYNYGISAWFRDDWISNDAITPITCNATSMKTFVFIQFMMTYFGGFLIGSFPAYILDIKKSFARYELCLPIPMNCSLYSACVHGLHSAQVTSVLRVIKNYFRRSVISWLNVYTEASYHAHIDNITDDKHLFMLLGVGMNKFLPRGLVDTLFYSLMKVYNSSTDGVRNRLEAGITAFHSGVCRIIGLQLQDLDVLLYFIPYSWRYITDMESWMTYNVLSRLHLEYIRLAITEFGLLSKATDNDYTITITRMNSLFHPSWQKCLMLKLLYKYIRCLTDPLFLQLDAAKPFHFNPRSQHERLLKLQEELNDCLGHRNVNTGLTVSRLTIRRVPTLGHICLCRLLVKRDMMPLHFLSQFKSARYIHLGIYNALLKTVNDACKEYY
jgi:hypothetical protein